MSELSLLAPAVSGAVSVALSGGAPAHLDPVKLFMDADIVVQVVLVALVLASVWVWTIIISFSVRMLGLVRGTNSYEGDFWKARDIEGFQADRTASKKGADLPVAKIVAAALGEWRRSVAGKVDRAPAQGWYPDCAAR